VYRISSTIHFLLFFFIILLADKNFHMSEKLVIMIAVLNDAATLVISVDAAQISQKPDKWRLGQLIVLSTVLAVLLVACSFATYVIAHAYDLSEAQVATCLYLQISSAPHFLIFSTRLQGWFWENRPSWIFLTAVLGTQVIATIISAVGVPALECAPIGWDWALSIIATSLLTFIVLDVVKVLVIRTWSFEVTAKLWPTSSRRRKLKERIAKSKVNRRVGENYQKIKTGVNVIYALNTMKTLVSVKSGASMNESQVEQKIDYQD
jgi:H+-transporting ATPase